MLDVKDFLRWLRDYEATFSGDRFPQAQFLGLIDRYKRETGKG